jgi:hypothetical protein
LAFYLAAIRPLLSAAAAALHDEHKYLLLVNSDQNLANSDQTVLDVAGGNSNKISI